MVGASWHIPAEWRFSFQLTVRSSLFLSVNQLFRMLILFPPAYCQTSSLLSTFLKQLVFFSVTTSMDILDLETCFSKEFSWFLSAPHFATPAHRSNIQLCSSVLTHKWWAVITQGFRSCLESAQRHVLCNLTYLVQLGWETMSLQLSNPTSPKTRCRWITYAVSLAFDTQASRTNSARFPIVSCLFLREFSTVNDLLSIGFLAFSHCQISKNITWR